MTTRLISNQVNSEEQLRLAKKIKQSIVPIHSMPDSLTIKETFSFIVNAYGCGYEASFLRRLDVDIEAKFSAAGTTRDEAVENLKDIIAQTFRVLCDHEATGLSRALQMQLKVLRYYLKQS